MIVNTISTIEILIIRLLMVYAKQEDSRPEHCSGSPELLSRFCCVIPPFFTREVAKECGAAIGIYFLKQNITGIRRHAFEGCNHWSCVLKKYGLVNKEGYLDHEKYFNHLDIWAGLNPPFAGVMLDAKVNCKQLFRFYLPLKICEFSPLNLCIRNYLRVECPVVIPTKACDDQRVFYKACGKYFV